WAAAIALLLLGAGALYAIPGSPLRRWIAALGGGQPKQGPAPTGPSAGIAVEPGARFRIVFSSRAAGQVTIVVTDGVAIEARRLDDGSTARFTAELDALLIDPGTSPGDFAIDIPRAAPWVEVLIAGRRIFLKDGLQIVTDARPDSLGRYVLSFH
ncbi:MAG TPA: hypothetical protein VN803_13440, partial [Gemmatimonadales bacterium]|nr:hypothetical protein [Gemmatimonadales bacterium]